MQTNFSKKITTPKGYQLVFSFSRIFTIHGAKYHVTVLDENHDQHFFNMQKQEGLWKIINAPSVPDWILKIEQQLVWCIVESLSS